MVLNTEWIRYGEGQRYLGYAAKPAGATGPLPAIVVFQEIWGVDEHIQDLANRFAAAGYFAFAPDLYAIDGERPEVVTPDRIADVKRFLETLPPKAWGSAEEREAELAKLPEERQTLVRETYVRLFSGLNMDLYVPQILATSNFLRNEAVSSQHQSIGSVGFCMGGALSARLACHDPQLKAAVIFYGNAPHSDLLAGIEAPVLGFYGGLDVRITDAVPEFASQMAAVGKSFEYHVYPEAQHAFFNDTRRSYHADAARDAFARTLSFFNQQLSPTFAG